MTIIPTFHCGGHCAEVVSLYQEAFNLVIDWQGKDETSGRIYHIEAHIGNQRLRLSDGGDPKDTSQADLLLLAVVFDTADEVERAFIILVVDGTVIQAPHKPDFASYMSELKDKFVFRWFLMVD